MKKPIYTNLTDDGAVHGTHVLVDAYRVPTSICLDDGGMLDLIVEAVKETTSMKIMGQMRYRFGADSDPGFTCICLLDASHCSVHTYAEQGKLAADFFTCGDHNPELIWKYVASKLGLKDYNIKVVPRFTHN